VIASRPPTLSPFPSSDVDSVRRGLRPWLLLCSNKVHPWCNNITLSSIDGKYEVGNRGLSIGTYCCSATVKG